MQARPYNQSLSTMHLTTCITSVVLLVANCAAQDHVKVAPDVAQVLYEDARIRVLRVHYAPGQAAPTHGHPPRAVIVLQSEKITSMTSDGRVTEDVGLPPNNFAFSAAETHSVRNTGTTPADAIEVELKSTPGAERPRPSDREIARDPLLRDPHHQWRFQNDLIRVVDARFGPGQSTEFHTHQADRVYVVLSSAKVQSQVEGEDWEEPGIDAAGTAGFTAQTTPTTHRVRNVGDTEYRVILIELLK
jgi:quercetin dioxygenase-like cupin family protein